MAYTKTVWEDLPSTNTPLNANNLNKIENELEALDANKYDASNVKNATSSSTTETYSADFINKLFTNLTLNTVEAGTAHASHSGGYYRLGNIVIVNVTVKGTSTGNKYILTGFPRPAQGVIACSCASATNGSISYSTISATGALEVNIADASNTYRITSVYITND